MEGAGGGSAKGTARVDALRGQIKLAYVIAGALSVPVAILAGAAWYIGGFGVGPAIMLGMIAALFVAVTLIGAVALRRAKRGPADG